MDSLEMVTIYHISSESVGVSKIALRAPSP